MLNIQSLLTRGEIVFLFSISFLLFSAILKPLCLQLCMCSSLSLSLSLPHTQKHEQLERSSRVSISPCLLSSTQQGDMVDSSSSSSSPSSTFISSSYSTKLRFFTRIQTFIIQIKLAGKCHGSLEHLEKQITNIQQKTEHHHHQQQQPSLVVTEEEINMTPSLVNDEVTTDEGRPCFLLQRSVKQLHFGSWEDKETAAKEIKRLAIVDLKTRKSLAQLGVVPTLVSMLDSDVSDRRRLAVQALIELANGTFTNKALMVEAGILKKMPGNVDKIDMSTRHDYALLALSISSLANSHFAFPSSEMLPFLIGVLDSDSTIEAKKACLGALSNVSSMLENVSPLVSNGLVSTLLKLTSEKDTSDKALAILGNLVVTVMGKKAIENDSMVPEIFIEAMTWDEKPKCQELSAYILMILAHQSSTQRAKMVQLGIVPVLLEVALLGSPLAQKRALKILQWFKDERQTKVGSHSGPLVGRSITIGSPKSERETNEGKRIIKKMVQQSLDKNMELITRRANGAAVDSAVLKGLIISSSSKSLPY